MSEQAQGPITGFRDQERGSTALIIIDMIGPMQFEGAAELSGSLAGVGEVIRKLRDDAHVAQVPVIYVNDNFGEWHSEASRLVERAEEAGGVGQSLAHLLRPASEDFFIIKPQFSGFYATNLPVLLPKLGVSRLILTGVAADICVLFTAGDAHMRDYDLWAPENALVARTTERKRWALEIMRQSMHAETRGTDDYPLEQWLADKEKREAEGS
jgi:nicotinamidase-related amidase